VSNDYAMVAAAACTFYSFTFAAACVSVGYICIVRIVCLKETI
jgi:hypothetical protein